jgi:hypothetical protein
MEQIVVSAKAAKAISMVRNAIAKSPTGVSFFSIKNYCNKFGEISNQLINVGISYKSQVEKDIEFLRNLDVTTLKWKSAMVDIIKARTTLIEAFISPSKARSEGQINAYTIITDGVKVHNETGLLYIYGYRVKKEVLQEGSYPVVNSRKDTIAKDEIRKLLKTNNFVNFSIEVGNEIRANGETLEL